MIATKEKSTVRLCVNTRESLYTTICSEYKQNFPQVSEVAFKRAVGLFGWGKAAM